MAINLKEIEQKVKPLGGKLKYDKEFIFDLLTAFGRSSSNITRLRNGQLNIANDNRTEVAQKNVVYFKPTSEDLYTVIDSLKSDPTVIRYSTRFVIVTDYNKLLAIDTKTNEPLDINIRDINKHYVFFLPWAGMEKAQFVSENHADVKAAEKMSKLFDEIIASNHGGNADYYHGLNVFFTRLLFCYFAEDTDIFGKSQFTNTIASYTQEDGSDVSHFLTELFTALDIEDRTGYSSHISKFPYVNGQLFRDSRIIPEFSRKARDLLIECGSKLDWSNINPDIFGSMIQAVVNPGQRAGLGMHYTSVPNIMKTIEPLFLDSLKEEINNNWDNAAKLEGILNRISRIKIFDPACGSGNFLIIAYKELRKLEHIILERQGGLGVTNATLLGSRIHIENFFGIEIDDFAHEVAILSLWLAKHQMNIDFSKKFGIDLPLIPLKEAGNIVLSNAARIDWNKICPNNGEDEIYLIGNPPYQGSKLQDVSQKADYKYVFKDEPYSKNLDYISLWFIKGSRYIAGSRAELAFVTTNSVSQGEHVGLMFPKIFSMGIEIGFAHTSFKWGNNAKHNAGVIVAIISLRCKSDKPKYIYANGVIIEAKNINGYLVDGNNVFIDRRGCSISGLPDMKFGNMPLDGGNLTFSQSEYDRIIYLNPEAKTLFKRFQGAEEYINAKHRYCLWVDNHEKEQLVNSIPLLIERVEATRRFRLSSKDKGTRRKAADPYRFREMHTGTNNIIVPRVSSERRIYLPIGYVDGVISDSAQAIYDAPIFVLGIISSIMHMVWFRHVAGYLGTSFRYSKDIVYNNFPVNPLTEKDKTTIEEKVYSVLDARENHPEKTLADIYDPDKMPDDLRFAHQQLDEVIDNIYRKKPFVNDEERLAYLFDLYEKMTTNERN